ncbi:hypothetical protein Ae201684_009031 [Aphanomyces euteiches]|uniref:Uncharacterized protein n=1 Tax=Aphanomyces euteiches TaxID=100861 RepID=A0A6G0X2N6_9STRA|nr:hypothetical protein Ae201684_009031 [Aphanomyces euteiches]
MASGVVLSMLGSYDLNKAQQWRTDDLQHRAQECQWRWDDLHRAHSWRRADVEREKRQNKLVNELRLSDARSDQLSTVSNMSVLLAGFAMAANVEISLPAPSQVPQLLIFVYGTTSAAAILCMLCCMLMCTMLLLALTQFTSHELEGELRALQESDLDKVSPLCQWWLKRCEHDWRQAYRLFRVGVLLFIITVVWVGWVQFHKSQYACIGTTVTAMCVFAFWSLRVESKWKYLFHATERRAKSMPKSKIYRIELRKPSTRPSVASTASTGTSLPPPLS